MKYNFEVKGRRGGEYEGEEKGGKFKRIFRKSGEKPGKSRPIIHRLLKLVPETELRHIYTTRYITGKRKNLFFKVVKCKT